MDGEIMEYRPIERAYLKVMRIRGLIAAAVLALVAASVDFALLRQTWLPAGLVPALVAAAGLVLAIAMPPRRWRAWGYALGEEELFIRAGLMVRYRTVVPFSRVQHIDVSQGPLERGHGLGRLILHTAGTRTAAVGLPGLDHGEAERIRDLIRSRIRQEPA